MLKQKQIWVSDTIPITISSKWLRHRFPCTKKYIERHCHGRCCQGSGKLLISLLPEEETIQRNLGCNVDEGFLLSGEKVCPHKSNTGLCGLHWLPAKPFGCIASPFTINKNDTLIVRHRYSMFKCHGKGRYAYKTFSASLNLLFGVPATNRQDGMSLALMPRSLTLHYFDYFPLFPKFTLTTCR